MQATKTRKVACINFTEWPQKGIGLNCVLETLVSFKSTFIHPEQNVVCVVVAKREEMRDIYKNAGAIG